MALNMLVNTTQGDTYTFMQYSTWLKQAGFKRLVKIDIGSHSPAILAHA